MRTLLITRHIAPHIGGTETSVTRFLRYAGTRADWEVDVAVLMPPEGRLSDVPGNIHLHYVKADWLFRALYKYREGDQVLVSLVLLVVTALLLAARAIPLVLRKNFDLIYAKGGTIALASGIIVKAISGLPLAMHFHTLRPVTDLGGFMRSLTIWMYRQADALIGNCKAFCDDAVAAGVEPGRCHWAWNWIEDSIFAIGTDREAAREEFGILSHEVAFVYCGRLEGWKQADRVLEALDTIEQPPNAVFFFAADGEYRPRLEELIERNSRVRCLGFLDKTKLNRLFNASDVMLWGSVDVDYPGLVVMEAMMTGLPVTVPNTTMNTLTPGAVVDASEYGFPKYVSTWDASPRGISDAIAFGTANCSELRALRPEIAAFARERFGFRNAERLAEILRSSCRQKGA
jgi:glycosyltransferase involved in cell wall biosynthesis